MGEVGPSYIPGHGHADTLSVEFSINGKSVIVNSGTSDYQAGQLRSFQRSTSAHSTVLINGFNSSEVWASFRVGRRAKVKNIFSEKVGSRYIFGAAHDGYARLNGGFEHKRVLDCGSKMLSLLTSMVIKSIR